VPGLTLLLLALLPQLALGHEDQVVEGFARHTLW
jgi:hypothetical protein